MILPDKNHQSNNIVSTAIFLSFFSLIMILIFLFLFKDMLSDLMGSNLFKLIYFIPIGVISLNIFNIFTYHNIKLKKYNDLSFSKIIKSVSLVFVQLSISIIDKSALGLLIGFIMSHIFGSIKLFFNTLNNNFLKDISFKKMRELSSRYSNFPKYDAPASLLDIASIQLPFLLMIKIGGEAVSGNFFLASRIIALPSSIIGQSMGQVYFQELNETKYKPGHSFKLLKNTINKLLIIALPSSLLIYTLSPYLFPIIFGDMWILGGQIAQYLAILSLIQLITVPLSSTLSLNRFIKRGAIWKSFNFLLLVSIYIYGIIYDLEFFQFLLYLTTVQFSLYVFYFIIIVKSVFDIEKDVLR